MEPTLTNEQGQLETDLANLADDLADELSAAPDLADELTAALAVAAERGPPSRDAARYLELRGARPREDTLPPATDPATGPATAAADPATDARDGAAAEVVTAGDVSVSAEWAARMALMPPLSRGLLAHNAPPSGVCAASLVREACVEAPLSRYCPATAPHPKPTPEPTPKPTPEP